jgi:hypothetical protein
MVRLRRKLGGPQIECDVQRGLLWTVAADEVKHGEAASSQTIASPIDEAGLRRQRCYAYFDERETVREVVAITGDQGHAVSVPARDDPVSVVFNLVNPARTRRRLLSRTWKARFNETGMEAGTLTQHLRTI